MWSAKRRAELLEQSHKSQDFVLDGFGQTVPFNIELIVQLRDPWHDASMQRMAYAVKCILHAFRNAVTSCKTGLYSLEKYIPNTHW